MADRHSTEEPIIARDAPPDSGGPAAPNGLHLAVCCDVIDLGLKTSAFGTKPKVKIVWQLAEVDAGTKRRYIVSRIYTNNLGPQASLRRDLESWRGRAFTKEELLGFNLLKLLGANCQLQTVATLREGGKTYPNVQAVVPPDKTKPKLVVVDYIRERDRAQPRGNAIGQPVNHVPF